MDEKLDIGRVFRHAFDIFGANAAPFLVVSTLLAGAPAFAIVMIAPAAPPLFGVSSFWSGFSEAAIPTFLLSACCKAFLLQASLRYLREGSTELLPDFVAALKLTPAVVVIALASAVAALVGAIFLIVPGIVVYVTLAVALPAKVEERGGIMASLDRSTFLTRDMRLTISAILFLMLVLDLSFGVVIGAFVRILAGARLDAFANLLTTPPLTVMHATVTAALFVELRRRKEGEPVHRLAGIFE